MRISLFAVFTIWIYCSNPSENNVRIIMISVFKKNHSHIGFNIKYLIWGRGMTLGKMITMRGSLKKRVVAIYAASKKDDCYTWNI